MKKRLLAVLTAASMVGSLAACGTSSTASTTAAAETKVAAETAAATAPVVYNYRL